MEERKDEVCDGCEVHEDLLKIVNETLPEETELYDLAELFKVFGDSTRIRILFVLFEAEVCVCDLAKALNMTQSAISHQLRILKQNKLVKNRREGKSIFYSLADDHVRTIINQGRAYRRRLITQKELAVCNAISSLFLQKLDLTFFTGIFIIMQQTKYI